MKQWNVPGVAVGIVERTRPLHMAGYGVRHLQTGEPVTPDTAFAIGSCTKAFTTAAMAILAGEGKLDWDTPVREYLPSFRLHDPVATELMTPRDLVTHRGGLPRHDMTWVGTPWTRSELFERIRHLEPSKSFRSTYQYNNLMFMVAGVLIERLADCSWESFVTERITRPLGMDSVTFSNVDMARSENHALGYDRRGKRIVHVPHENTVPVGPAGSMNASLADMCRWVAMNLNRGRSGRRRIVNTDALAVTHTPQTVYQNDDEPRYAELLDPAYAMGWTVQPYRGRRQIAHSGCVDGFNARTSFLPDDGFGVVVLTNVTNSPLLRIISYNVYDRMLGLDPVSWGTRFRKQEQAKRRATRARSRRRSRTGTRPSVPLADYAGRYENPGYGTMEVRMNGKRLQAVYNGITRSLQHEQFDQFGMVFRGTWPGPNRRVVFRIDEAGRVGSLAAALQEGVADIVFIRAKG
jgi:CubicO group peptidase (beta-lactamase class C family)